MPKISNGVESSGLIHVVHSEAVMSAHSLQAAVLAKQVTMKPHWAVPPVIIKQASKEH
jgi:hypothetical protein